MGSKMSSSSPVLQIDTESYPHVDEGGNFMAYKEGGRWVNWWARNAPGGPTIMAGFALGKDDSGIPGSKVGSSRVRFFDSSHDNLSLT